LLKNPHLLKRKYKT